MSQIITDINRSVY